MRAFLVSSFYLCGVAFLIYEMLKVGGLNMPALVKEWETKAKAEQEENKELKTSSTLEEPKLVNQLTYTVIALPYMGFMIAYMAWAIVGLFTSQWIFFLTILGLSLLHGLLASIYKNYTAIILRVDAIITMLILVFLFINRFQLHII